MQTVLVRALRDFDFEGVVGARNEVLAVTPVQAAILARAHHVNLSETHLTLAAPAPAPAHVPSRTAPDPQGYERRDKAAESTGADTAPKTRRTYRRRDKKPAAGA